MLSSIHTMADHARPVSCSWLNSVSRKFHNSEEPKLDVLMNNAGVMMLPEGKTVDGFETQFATNVLGTEPPLPLVIESTTP